MWKLKSQGWDSPILKLGHLCWRLELFQWKTLLEWKNVIVRGWCISAQNDWIVWITAIPFFQNGVNGMSWLMEERDIANAWGKYWKKSGQTLQRIKVFQKMQLIYFETLGSSINTQISRYSSPSPLCHTKLSVIQSITPVWAPTFYLHDIIYEQPLPKIKTSKVFIFGRGCFVWRLVFGLCYY